MPRKTTKRKKQYITDGFVRFFKVIGWSVVVSMAISHSALFYQYGKNSGIEELLQYSECSQAYIAMGKEKSWEFNQAKKREILEYIEEFCPEHYEKYKENRPEI